VWSVLSDVATIPDWFPGVESALEDDGFRQLNLANGTTLRARVVTSDDQLRRFQYAFIEGMPVPITFHLGTLDVIADGAGSLVVYSQEVKPDELGKIVGPAVAGGIDGIRAYFGG
jgi:hypothetical protein